MSSDRRSQLQARVTTLKAAGMVLEEGGVVHITATGRQRVGEYLEDLAVQG